jgi:flap endonuclease-1
MFIGFWNQIMKLLSHKVIPLYIFDGQAPNEKNNVIDSRNKKRKNMKNKLKDIYSELTDEYEFSEDNKNISDTNNIELLENEKNRLEKSIIYIKKIDIENIRNFFDILNIPYLDAKGEADSLCAKLFKEGHIMACLSDDMDMLALGCLRTIKFQDGKVYEFDLVYIMDKLNLTYEQFVEMCILFGCDYIKPMFKLINTESYELIQKYGSIENILNLADHPILNKNNEKCANFINEYITAKNILMTSSESEIIPEYFSPCINNENEIDPFIVLKYLKIYGQINFVDENMERIIDNIEHINNFISYKYFCRT